MPDLSDMPSTDGVAATEAPVVAGADETFDDLGSATPLSADGGATQPGGEHPDNVTDPPQDGGGG